MPVKKRTKIKPNRSSKAKLVFVLFFALAIIFFAWFFYRVLSSIPDRLVTAVVNKEGQIEVVVYDFAESSVSRMEIPKDTQMDLAMQRGVLTAESAVAIKNTEKLPGGFVSNSVMRTFSFPIDYFHADMPLVLKAQALLLGLRANTSQRIDLAKSGYLAQEPLKLGVDGYVVKSQMPLQLASLFVDSKIAGKQTVVQISNLTGQANSAMSPYVAILESLGAKVAPIIRDEPKDMDCYVSAIDQDVMDRVAGIFDCDPGPADPDGFDINIVLGSRFYERF